MICPMGRAEYFDAEGWTVESALIALAKFNYWLQIFIRHSGASQRVARMRAR
jgi:hypothetical protein